MLSGATRYRKTLSSRGRSLTVRIRRWCSPRLCSMHPALPMDRIAIGNALAAAQALIEDNDVSAFRRVIDFSGDSANNFGGIPIAQARASALAADIVINGLAILCRQNDCSGRPNLYDLEDAFAKAIIGGARQLRGHGRRSIEFCRCGASKADSRGLLIVSVRPCLRRSRRHRLRLTTRVGNGLRPKRASLFIRSEIGLSCHVGSGLLSSMVSSAGQLSAGFGGLEQKGSCSVLFTG